MRKLLLILAALLLLAPAAPAAAAQTLTWTADNDVTRYRSAPATAAAGATTIVFENSEATGNTTGMPHTLTFDTSTEGYNHDVTLNILANPFDATGGRHEATVTLTPGKYRYFCAIPGHGTMVGEFTVTGGGGEPDTTAPVVNAAVTGDGTATATVTVTSSEAGVIEYALDTGAFQPYTAPVVVTAAGEHTVRYRATDAAGNTSAVGSVAFEVVSSVPADTTPPTAQIQLAGDRNAAGEYVGPVTATVTASDAGSGVARIEYQLDGGAWRSYTNPVLIDGVGPHMLHYRAADNAGNTSVEQMSHFTVVAADTVAPVTAASVTGEGTATATVTVTSSEPGVIEYALDAGAWVRYSAPIVVTAAGAHTVRYRATDAAGNVAPEKSVTFTVAGPGSGEDACPGSDLRATVIIDGHDTGVPNDDTGEGCTVNDLVAENASYPGHAAFVRHVETVTAALVARGALTKRQQGAIVRAAARSDIGSL